MQMGKWRPMVERLLRWLATGRMRTQLSCLSSSTVARGAGGSTAPEDAVKNCRVTVRDPNRKFRKADLKGPRTQDCPVRERSLLRTAQPWR